MVEETLDRVLHRESADDHQADRIEGICRAQKVTGETGSKRIGEQRKRKRHLIREIVDGIHARLRLFASTLPMVSTASTLVLRPSATASGFQRCVISMLLCRFSRAGLAACQRSSSDARHTPRRERDRMTLNLAPASSMMSLVVIRGAIARRVTLVHRTREPVGTWLWGIVQRQVSIQLPRRGTLLHNAGGACVCVVERWRRHHNTHRPHSAQGYRPAAQETTAIRPVTMETPLTQGVA